MFRGIISRENGCPWGETGMTSAKWRTIPVRPIGINELIATQPGLLLEALIGEPKLSYSRDPFIHVIDWAGEFYLEDGHHRCVRAWGNGDRVMLARILTIRTKGNGNE